MIRQRLDDLSMESLLIVASHNQLKLDPDITRVQLVEELVEAISESRREREAGSSPSVRVQQAKYTGPCDDEIPLDHDSITALPERYACDRITLMLRDPYWAFTFWDLGRTTRDDLSSARDFDGLSLRVIEVEDHDRNDITIIDAFEIPVQLPDAGWYFYVPRQNARYRVQLLARRGGERRLVALSNQVYVPRAGLPVAAVDLAPAQLAVLELCGVELLEAPAFVEPRPARGASA